MKRISRKLKNFLYLILSYWQEFQESKSIKKFAILLNDSQKKLYNANFKYWNNQSPIETKKNGDLILIEGFLVEYGPNYLYRTGLIAKAIESKYPQLTSTVIYDDFAHKNKSSIKLYESFGIKEFVFLRRNFTNILFSITASIHARKLFKSIEDGKGLVNLQYKGILIGDLLYDELVHGIPGCKTIDKIEEIYYPFFYSAIYSFLKYDYFFKKNPVKYLVSTHVCYLQYGLLCRIALKSNSALLVTTDIDLTFVNEYTKKQQIQPSPVYHEFVLKYVQDQLKINNRQKSIIRSKEYLKERFLGNIKQIDVQLAFTDKNIYTLDTLCKKLDLPKRKTYFIMTHIVSDAPHSSSLMVYKDYYEWLERTIEICSKITNVNWVIKPHPAAKVYNEENLAAEMLAKHFVNHIKICPADFNSSSIVECASGILSVQGTAGLEFACVGIPIILTGQAFYSGFGFTRNCFTEEDYIDTLKKVEIIPPLNEEQQEQALLVLDTFRSYNSDINLVIDADTLMYVWGYKERNIDLVLLRMSEKLQSQIPQLEPQYIKCLQLVKNT